MIKNKLLQTKFYNRLTNQPVESSYLVVLKFIISKNYVFFASNVLLLTIGITLFIFVIYHLSLVKLNLTTNEKIKKDKLIKFMIIIKQTLGNLYQSCEYKDAGINKDSSHKDFKAEYEKDYKKINLTKDDFNRFDEIVFNSKRLLLIYS